MAYVSEPVWASELVEAETEMLTLEGPTVAPVGSRIVFSDDKGIYFVVAEKWVQLGFELVG